MADENTGDVPPQEETEFQGLTPEEQAAVDAIKRRNLRIAIIFGIVLLVLGFFAGRYLKHNKEDSFPDVSTSVVCDVSGQSAVCL